MKYIKEFRRNGELIALLVKKEFEDRKTAKHASFISADTQSLQLGIGYYPKNLIGPRHSHTRIPSKAFYEELLHLVRGKMRVDLYGKDKVKFVSFVMRAGDTVHLISGGHGFKMLTPCKCIEIKQGPFTGQNNKELF